MIITRAGVYLPFLILLISLLIERIETCIPMIPSNNVVLTGIEVDTDSTAEKKIKVHEIVRSLTTFAENVQVFPQKVTTVSNNTPPKAIVEESKRSDFLVEKALHITSHPPTDIEKSDNIFIETTKNIEKTTNQLIEQTVLVVKKSPELKTFVSVFSACHLKDIHYSPPGLAVKRDHIITPIVTCSKKSTFGCQTAHITCETPSNSVFPLVSGFAKIDGADWATTDLKTVRAEFLLECDIYNRWTYISDIPGIAGKIFPTNQIFCLLVPILTASSSDPEFRPSQN